MQTLKGKLNIIERLNNSTMGNPRYKCEIEGVTFVTKPNSMYGYGITNYENKEITVQVGYYYNKLSLMQIDKQ